MKKPQKPVLVLIILVVLCVSAFWGYRRYSPGDITPSVSLQEGSNESATNLDDVAEEPPRPVICVDIEAAKVVEVDGVPTLPCAYPADGERCAVICHIPNDNPGAKHTLLISFEAMKGHMSQHEDGSDSKDTIGPCETLEQKPVQQACTQSAADL